MINLLASEFSSDASVITKTKKFFNYVFIEFDFLVFFDLYIFEMLCFV